MKALYELKEKFEMELEELARKGELGAGDLELKPVGGSDKLSPTFRFFELHKICIKCIKTETFPCCSCI